MPGVYRPLNLVDVLGVIYGQASTSPDTTISGIGYFAEVDEQVTAADAGTAFVQTNADYEQTQWGCFSWG